MIGRIAGVIIHIMQEKIIFAWRYFEHLDAHVFEHANDDVEVFGVHNV